MTREEAVKEIEKVFKPAFANYIITALTEGATVSDKEPTTKNDLAQERYQDLKEYFGDKETAKTILENKKEFKAWLERVKWHVKRADELARELEVLKQEPITKNDLALINTEGLDEDIRCAMCTNSMANDRGCDGSCVVNNGMYKAVMDAIGKRIQPTTKNDLGVDCVARQDIERYIEGFINEYTPKEELEFINLELDGLKHLPSTTPQEPKTGHWIKQEDGTYKCSNCKKYELWEGIYCASCGAKMIEPQESEDKE